MARPPRCWPPLHSANRYWRHRPQRLRHEPCRLRLCRDCWKDWLSRRDWNVPHRRHRLRRWMDRNWLLRPNQNSLRRPRSPVVRFHRRPLPLRHRRVPLGWQASVSRSPARGGRAWRRFLGSQRTCRRFGTGESFPGLGRSRARHSGWHRLGEAGWPATHRVPKARVNRPEETPSSPLRRSHPYCAARRRGARRPDRDPNSKSVPERRPEDRWRCRKGSLA